MFTSNVNGNPLESRDATGILNASKDASPASAIGRRHSGLRWMPVKSTKRYAIFAALEIVPETVTSGRKALCASPVPSGLPVCLRFCT
jgi:hypothetical protein